MSLALLALIAAVLLLQTRADVRDYARFKAADTTQGRQRYYARWLLQAFVGFTMGSLAGLALLGRLSGIVQLPEVFVPLAMLARGDDPDPGFMALLAVAMLVGLV